MPGAATHNTRDMTRRPPDCRLRVLRLPQPQQSFHLRQTPLLVQLPERRVPRLVQVLQGSLTLLLRCRAGLGCGTLHAGSVGRLSGRLFPSIGGLPLRVLVGHREFPRHPFGGLPFHPCPLVLRRSVCLPGTLGFLSGLPVAFDLPRSLRPTTRSGFAELLHLPELLGSLTRLRQLCDFLLPLRLLLLPLLPRLLADTGQFELLNQLQALTQVDGLHSQFLRYLNVLESALEIPLHLLKQSTDFLRDMLSLDRYPSAGIISSRLE